MTLHHLFQLYSHFLTHYLTCLHVVVGEQPECKIERFKPSRVTQIRGLELVTDCQHLPCFLECVRGGLKDLEC